MWWTRWPLGKKGWDFIAHLTLAARNILRKFQKIRPTWIPYIVLEQVSARPATSGTQWALSAVASEHDPDSGQAQILYKVPDKVLAWLMGYRALWLLVEHALEQGLDSNHLGMHLGSSRQGSGTHRNTSIGVFLEEFLWTLMVANEWKHWAVYLAICRQSH